MQHDVRAIDLDISDSEDAAGVVETTAIYYRRSVMVVLVTMDGRNFTGTAVHYSRDVALEHARTNAMHNMKRLFEKWGREMATS